MRVGGSLLVILGKGDGTFASPRPVAGAPGATSIATADLGGDGRIDLVLAGADSTTALIKSGRGSFRIAETVPSAGRLRVADVDGDGILLPHGGVLTVCRGKGDGTFEVGRVFGFGGRDFGVGDIDGDGLPEAVSPLIYVMSTFVAVVRNASRSRDFGVEAQLARAHAGREAPRSPRGWPTWRRTACVGGEVRAP